MKRSGFAPRSKPLKASGPAKTAARLRKCPVKKGGCGQMFAVARDGQKCCLDCALAVGKWLKAQSDDKAARAEAKQHREKLAASKSLKHWLGVTERVLNHFILVRDHDKGCISCGTFTSVLFQAGHYLSVGARREHRFSPFNIAKQCHRCNVHLSGNQAAYRIELVKRYGEEIVQGLENDHVLPNWTRESLAEIRKQAAAATRLIEKGMR